MNNNVINLSKWGITLTEPEPEPTPDYNMYQELDNISSNDNDNSTTSENATSEPMDITKNLDFNVESGPIYSVAPQQNEVISINEAKGKLILFILYLTKICAAEF